MPAEVQQLVKTARSAEARSKKSAANGASEDFGKILKQANKPRAKTSTESESRPVQRNKEQEPAKTESTEKPSKGSVEKPTEKPAESHEETVSQTKDNTEAQTDTPSDQTDDQHEPSAQDYAVAAQAVVPQPVVLKQNEPAKPEQKPQATVSAAAQSDPTTVAALDKQLPQVPDNKLAPKEAPPQPVSSPIAQAKNQPALTLGEPVAESSDDSKSSSGEHQKAQQTNPKAGQDANALNAEMAVAQTTPAAAEADHPATSKTDLNAKIDMVIAPLGDSATPKHAQAVTNTPAAPPPVAPEAQFAQDNHPKIITALRSEIAGSNGTMHIRLDPPELGALQVTVRMRDGIMSASFETSNDEATKLLSHSLTQLKQVLESQGVSIDKLHVQQSARSDKNATGDEHQNQQNHQQGHSSQQEQQRKEMIRRMWRRLGVGNDPLDLVA